MDTRTPVVDLHAHLQFDAYASDREEVVARMKAAGVVAATVGTGAKTSREAVELAKVLGTPATVGLHPAEVPRLVREGLLEKEWGEIVALANEPEVRVIGECGFDFFHEEASTRKIQEEVFMRHIELAKEKDVPLMLHLRSAKDAPAGQSAYRRALDILKEFSDVRSNAHFFAGTQEEAREFLNRGDTVSVTGVLTFATEYKELVEFVPLDRLHAETDAPYVAPVPYRGTRNEPTFVVEVVKAIAEIKKLPLEVVTAQLWKNAISYYGEGVFAEVAHTQDQL